MHCASTQVIQEAVIIVVQATIIMEKQLYSIHIVVNDYQNHFIHCGTSPMVVDGYYKWNGTK